MLEISITTYATYGDLSFSYAAPTLWNKLPDECRMAITIDCFKSTLKICLFKQRYEI